VFAKALSKAPDQRFESCTAFVEALDGCFRGGRAAVASKTGPAHQPRRKPWLAATAVLAIAASSLLVSAYFRRGPKPSQVAPQNLTTLRTGEVHQSRRDGLSYVWIAPGSFQMGCSPGDTDCEADEQAHRVTLTNGYWISQTEVTVRAYKRFCAATGGQIPAPHAFNSNWANETVPISNVGWNDAAAYCRWAQARLPTEAEWEMAARSGSAQMRYGALDEVAWHKDNSGGSPHAVGGKRPNGFGLADMLGNVWEWTADRYARDYYSVTAVTNPVGPNAGNFRVLRGGSWLRSASEVRVSDRYPVRPDSPDHGIGFRCAADEMP
jgi:formylglycine-generating enzyme required for sulfatase activity